MIPTEFFAKNQDLLRALLIDHSRDSVITISSHSSEISPGLILKEIILPRVNKNSSSKKRRIKSYAEVFTPAWICNIQNNLIDNRWFNQKNLFNKEIHNGWKTNLQKIPFDNKRKWFDYIDQTRLEICCGEAPYITSRYDAVSGKEIKVFDRIGLLDRKLRVVSENTETASEWLKYAILAYQHIYGYEKNGDNLILSRINLLFTFIEFFEEKFRKQPSKIYLKKIATIISWNLWQMDCLDEKSVNSCYIMDWQQKKKIKFSSLLK